MPIQGQKMLGGCTIEVMLVGGFGMKPITLKTLEGLYVCEIPIENEPEDGASDRTWWIWAATGVSSVSPVEAYDKWVLDYESKLGG
jgi:hypothetical protein